jgi:hypothetical protein
MTTLFHNLLGSPVRELSAALESWPNGNAEASEAKELEDTVRRCLELSAQLDRKVKEVFRKFDEIDDLYLAHVQLRTAFENAKVLIRGVQAWAAAMDNGQSSVLGGPELADTLRQVEKLEHDLFQHWTLPTEEDVQRALEEDARGETMDLTDAFASMRGMTREAWLQHVEEYRRSRKP